MPILDNPQSLSLFLHLERSLLDFALEVLPLHQIGYIVVILIVRLASLSSVLLLQALVALC